MTLKKKWTLIKEAHLHTMKSRYKAAAQRKSYRQKKTPNQECVVMKREEEMSRDDP